MMLVLPSRELLVSASWRNAAGPVWGAHSRQVAWPEYRKLGAIA
jgi:hypothetical protein